MKGILLLVFAEAAIKLPKEPYPTLDGIQFILDELAEDDLRAEQIKPETLIDKSFIEKLDREGFVKKKL